MTRCVYSKRVGADFKDTSQSLHTQIIPSVLLPSIQQYAGM